MLLNTQVQRTFIMPTRMMMPMIRGMLQKSMKLKLLMKSKYLNPGKRIIPSIKMKVVGGHYLFANSSPLLSRKLKIGGKLIHFVPRKNVTIDCVISLLMEGAR